MKIREIAARFGVTINVAGNMIERGRFCEGRVVEDCDDDTPVRHVLMPTAICRTLIRMGVRTVREARQVGEAEFRRNGKCGPAAMQALREVLASRG